MVETSNEGNVQGWPPIDLSEHPHLSENEIYLSGWPGYRNRPGRSGLDYLDNEFELAHMEGRFIRALITLNLRSGEVFHLFLMLIVGLFSLLLGLLPVVELFSGGFVYPIAWCYSFIPGFIGLFLLLNFVLSLKFMFDERINR